VRQSKSEAGAFFNPLPYGKLPFHQQRAIHGPALSPFPSACRRRTDRGRSRRFLAAHAAAFQLDHINLWLLRDGNGWVIIDTGFPEDHVRETWSLILDRLDGPVNKLVVTHFHPDHLGLATWLMEKTGAGCG